MDGRRNNQSLLSSSFNRTPIGNSLGILILNLTNLSQTSCLHETFFGAAIEEAKALDHYYAKHKCPSGPLHGLPVSLKDQFHVRGVETTMGYVGWIGTFQGATGTGKEKTYESEMVQELRSLGAVLYVKTSVPHTLMCGETINNIIGYTQNPKNRNLSSGGSSGGEGALIGLRGSPIGFGTDIGGVSSFLCFFFPFRRFTIVLKPVSEATKALHS